MITSHTIGTRKFTNRALRSPSMIAMENRGRPLAHELIGFRQRATLKHEIFEKLIQGKLPVAARRPRVKFENVRTQLHARASESHTHAQRNLQTKSKRTPNIV